MPGINLTQSEADFFMQMEKIRANDERFSFPTFGGVVQIPLVSRNRREKFLLDISRGKIDLMKVTFQNRTRQIVILIRMDLSGPPHKNPDEQEIRGPHLHVYREGYGDKWALPVPVEEFPHLTNPYETLDDFMAFCKIAEPPIIERGLI